MLLNNYSVLNSNPGRGIGGGGVSNIFGYFKAGTMYNFYTGDATVQDVTNKSSFNNGYTPPYSYLLAPKAGGIAMGFSGNGTLSSDLIPQYLALLDMTGSGDLAAIATVYGNIICALTGSSSFTAAITASGNITLSFTGSGGLTATIAGNGGISIDMSGSGTLSAGGSLFLNMIAAMSGNGTLSANASLLVSMLCDMSGGGTLTAAIVGQKNMSVSLTGSGDLLADINAFALMIVDLIGVGSLNGGAGAIANMSIDMTVTGAGLSTANVGQAVWTAILNQFSADPDSAAAKLLAAGSAGDPWSTSLPAAYTGSQAGNILAKIQTLVDELHKIEGLSPGNIMTVTPTSRTAGGINLSISGDGETITEVERI